MIQRTVHAVLNESVQEVMGSAMSNKEDAIEEIVQYVAKKWEQFKEFNRPPTDVGTFEFKDGFKDGGANGGKIERYVLLIPDSIAEKLDIADYLQINVVIENFIFDTKYLPLFGDAERSTEAATWQGGGEYSRFNKTTFKMENGRIDLTVPAILGELQTKDFHSTLYHELNHAFTGLQIKKKRNDLPDNELDRLDLNTMSRRGLNHPHRMVYLGYQQDPALDMLRRINFGSDEEAFRDMNFIFYSVWERTERNARAESIYGDLKELGATRENFKMLYPKTQVARNIRDLSMLLDKLRKVSALSNIWPSAADVMNMRPRGRGEEYDGEKFNEKVKERFISRTEQLLDILFRRAMKVAELYFQKRDPKPKQSRLEKYKQEHNK